MKCFAKTFLSCFRTPLTRNAQKRTKKKVKKKSIWGWFVPRKLIKYTSKSLFFLGWPLGLRIGFVESGSILCVCVFGGFVTRGVQKRVKKSRSRSRQKKQLAVANILSAVDTQALGPSSPRRHFVKVFGRSCTKIYKSLLACGANQLLANGEIVPFLPPPLS
jgi:hypothetical protein